MRDDDYILGVITGAVAVLLVVLVYTLLTAAFENPPCPAGSIRIQGHCVMTASDAPTQ